MVAMRSRRLFAAVPISLAIVAAGVFLIVHRSAQLGTQPSSRRHLMPTASRPAEPSPEDVCEQRRHALELEPALSGTPQLESVRAEVVARAKAEPVLFLEPPKDTTASPEVSVLRERLYHKTLPWKTFGEVYLRYRRHPRELRQVLLTDGYLYAEQPAVAALLANSVVLNQLFTERAIVTTRGSQTLHAKRKSGDYYWTDGPERGMPATLWLFDRVAVEGENLGPSKLVALGDIRSKTGADAIEIERLTQGAILAQLVYGDSRVAAILAIRQNELTLDCEVLRTEARAKVEYARSLAKRKALVLARLRASIDEEVAEIPTLRRTQNRGGPARWQVAPRMEDRLPERVFELHVQW